MNNLSTEILLKLSRGMTKEDAEVVSELIFPFTSRASQMEYVISIRTQQYVAQEL